MPLPQGERVVLGLYGLWAAVAVALSLLNAGLNADNTTRLLVIVVLLTGVLWLAVTRAPHPAGGVSFVVQSSVVALAVEACYMPSRPVFAALTFVPGMTVTQAIENTLIDWAFTLPAYLVIYAVTWRLLRAFRYRFTEILLLFPLGQALGDGNAFFIAQPAMLVFAPYVMLNYQAILLVPVVRAAGAWPASRNASRIRWVLPVLVLPALYWVAGALIIASGRHFGLA